MNIADAVRVAMKTGGCITTPEWRDILKIRPTNTSNNCVVSAPDGSNPTKRGGWQPDADALTRDDWIVTV